MAQFSASAVFMAIVTASWFNTGRAPGKPRHTGQTLEFGGSPKCVEQEQKIFDLVRSCKCTSRPITASYFVRATVETVIGRIPCRKLSRPAVHYTRFRIGPARPRFAASNVMRRNRMLLNCRIAQSEALRIPGRRALL